MPGIHGRGDPPKYPPPKAVQPPEHDCPRCVEELRRVEAAARENADERGRCEVKWKKVSTQEGVVHFLVGSEALCLVAAVRDSQYSTPRTEAPTVQRDLIARADAAHDEWTVYAARDGKVHAVVPAGVTWTQEGEDAVIHKFRIQRQAKFDRERTEYERQMAAYAARERQAKADRHSTILRLGLPRAASDDGPSMAAKRVAAAIGAVLASAFLWCFIALFVPLGISTPIAFLSLLIGGAVLQVLPHAMAYAPQKAPKRPQPTPTPVAAPAPVVPPLKDHSDRSIEAHNGLPCETCGISLEDTFDWWSRQHPIPTEEAK